MKKLIAAVVLALILSIGSSAHVISPIVPLPRGSFVDVEVPYVHPSTPKEAIIIEPVRPTINPTKPPIPTPTAHVHVVVVPKSTPQPKVAKVTSGTTTGFRLDRNVSWYGPGFYGRRTACGLAYTKTIMGVAHKTLPCGTKVTFLYKGVKVVVPVIDRGPYVAGRQWDLSGALCTFLRHCFTGPIYYAIGSH